MSKLSTIGFNTPITATEFPQPVRSDFILHPENGAGAPLEDILKMVEFQNPDYVILDSDTFKVVSERALFASRNLK